MADQDREKQLDDLLDSLLSQYASSEPRPGLETRVFARIAESRRFNDSRVRRLPWLIAGGVAASAVAIVIVLLVFRTTQRPHSSSSVAQNGHTQQMVQTGKPTTGNSAISVMKKGIHISKSAAMHAAGNRNGQLQSTAVIERPAVFPTPVPLNEQERLMFTYLANTPREEVVGQIKSDDEKEAATFWTQGEPMPGTQRPAITR